jgi:hypothetical protein
MRSHFAVRWNINENLYQVAITRQKNYLSQILQNYSDPRKQLRRNMDRVIINEKYVPK